MRSTFDLRRLTPFFLSPPTTGVPAPWGPWHLGELQHCPHCRVHRQPGLEMLYPHPIHHGTSSCSVAGAQLQPPKASSHATGEGNAVAASLNLLHSFLTSVPSPQGYRECLILPSKHLVEDQTSGPRHRVGRDDLPSQQEELDHELL